MDDNDIRQLFNDFHPSTSDDNAFLGRLRHQLDLVDIVKAQSMLTRKKTRCATILAAIVGFITGFTLSLLLPHICSLVTRLHLETSSLNFYIDVDNFYTVISWLIVGSITTFIAVKTYKFVSMSMIRYFHPTGNPASRNATSIS